MAKPKTSPDAATPPGVPPTTPATDPLTTVTAAQTAIADQLAVLKALPANSWRSMAISNLKEALRWLGVDRKGLKDAAPAK